MKKISYLSICILCICFGFTDDQFLTKSSVKNAITINYTGKFIRGACADNPCDCKSCYYVFKDARGNEITFDEVDAKIKLQLLISSKSGEVKPNSKFLNHEFLVDYVKADCICIDPDTGGEKVETVLKIVALKMIK